MSIQLPDNIRMSKARARAPNTGRLHAAWLAAVFAVVLLLTACGGQAPDVGVGQVSQAVTPTAAGIVPADTPTPAPAATNTAEPPTSTPSPAPTDTPTTLPTATNTPEPPTPVLTPTESAAGQTGQATTEAGQPPTTTAEEPPEDRQPYELPFLGPPDAAVTIVEFGDYF